MTWTPQNELMMRVSVAHAEDCQDFMKLPRVDYVRPIARCRHCKFALWTDDELRKAKPLVAAMGDSR